MNGHVVFRSCIFLFAICATLLATVSISVAQSEPIICCDKKVARPSPKYCDYCPVGQQVMQGGSKDTLCSKIDYRLQVCFDPNFDQRVSEQEVAQAGIPAWAVATFMISQAACAGGPDGAQSALTCITTAASGCAAAFARTSPLVKARCDTLSYTICNLFCTANGFAGKAAKNSIVNIINRIF